VGAATGGGSTGTTGSTGMTEDEGSTTSGDGYGYGSG
jgi:hypothetical protein